MKNFKFIFIGLSFLASASFAHAVDLNCWDSTFGYNQASVVEANDRIELSLKGSNIGPLSFSHLYEGMFIVPEWNLHNRIHVPFKKEECTLSADGKQGRCEKIFVQNSMKPAAFIERVVHDLSEKLIEVITPVRADRVVLEYAVGADLRLEFYGNSPSGDDPAGMQMSVVRLKRCNDPMPGGPPRFPVRLIEYLK